MTRRMPLLLAALLAAAPGRAASYPVDLVPMIGGRNGADLETTGSGFPPASASGSVSFGLGVEVPVRPEAWFEAFLDHQTLSFSSDSATQGSARFDFSVDYLQFGGGYQPGEGKIRPFVAASVGLTRYGASPGEVGNTLGASGSIAGGFKAPIGKKVAFKIELRGYATITDAAVSVTCGAGCSTQFVGSGWYQIAARAGLTIRL